MLHVLSNILTISNGNCQVAVDPAGVTTVTSGSISAILAPTSPDGTAPSDFRVEQSEKRIVIRSKSSGFGRESIIALPEGGDVCLVHVRNVLTAERGGTLPALVDRWKCRAPAPFDYRWIPNLRPDADMRTGSHCFRSPVVMLSGAAGGVALIPDFSDDRARYDVELCALDLDVKSTQESVLGYGIEPTRPTRHVYFEVDPSVETQPGAAYRFDYYLLLSEEPRGAFLRRATAFLWRHFATPYLDSALPQTVPFDAYAGYAYPSLVSMPPLVSFELGGRKAGGIKAESGHAEYFRRPDPVVWNQAWFNGQRAAYGMGVFGKRIRQETWLEAGRLITATTLGAPDWLGLWPAIYAYEDREWWGSIPRLNGGRRRVHVADAAMTGEWLLRWMTDVEDVPGGMDKLRALADRLCRVQHTDGSIPPWFDFDGSQLQPDETLLRSAETGAAAVFLGEVAGHAGFERAGTAVLRAAEFLASEVMPGQKYQDFETFFSCSAKDLDMTDPYTGIPPQNSLAVYWTARTMLAAYRLTKHDELLRLAAEATDILSLYQQVWNPPFLNLYAFGGFGVMNTDAEWNDARQSLFAPHYFAMYEATGLDEYLQRGLAALRASFVLASIPENETVSPNTFSSYPPGLMPENYGHSGTDKPAGRSDTCWGESGALTSVAWLRVHYPALVTDLPAR